MKNVNPHVAEMMMTDQIHFRASRYRDEVVDVVVSAKRRIY